MQLDSLKREAATDQALAQLALTIVNPAHQKLNVLNVKQIIISILINYALLVLDKARQTQALAQLALLVFISHPQGSVIHARHQAPLRKVLPPDQAFVGYAHPTVKPAAAQQLVAPA